MITGEGEKEKWAKGEMEKKSKNPDDDLKFSFSPLRLLPFSPTLL